MYRFTRYSALMWDLSLHKAFDKACDVDGERNGFKTEGCKLLLDAVRGLSASGDVMESQTTEFDITIVKYCHVNT
jgi:hypothetical protein